MATPAVMYRGGYSLNQSDLQNSFSEFERSPELVAMPQVEISSSEIRQRVGEGRSIRYRTPRAIEAYIEAQALYR